jgi:hypothetical protein
MSASPTPEPVVLIVSSDRWLRELASVVLAAEGWRPHTFASPETGFRYLLGRIEDVALLVLDARAEASHGVLALGQRARTLRSDLHLMVLVGADDRAGEGPLDCLVREGPGRIMRMGPQRNGPIGRLPERPARPEHRGEPVRAGQAPWSRWRRA